jgi:hypothetical protein
VAGEEGKERVVVVGGHMLVGTRIIYSEKYKTVFVYVSNK